MANEYIGLRLDDMRLTLDECAASCMVSREWIVEHVQAGLLLAEPGPDLAQWSFDSRDLVRTRRLIELEQTFEADPALAGLVADLIDELERLRSRLHRAGVSTA